MAYEDKDLNEYEKNIMGYVYAFSALGFLPIEIEIYNASVVMGIKKKRPDGEYMYKFNEMDLSNPDMTLYSNQIVDEANEFYNFLVERGTDQSDLDSFKEILLELEFHRGDIWEMGNLLVDYMNERAPMWLREKFFRHKSKVCQSLNLLLLDANHTTMKSKEDKELDTVIKNMNDYYHGNNEKTNAPNGKSLDELNGRMLTPKIRPLIFLTSLRIKLGLVSAVMGL